MQTIVEWYILLLITQLDTIDRITNGGVKAALYKVGAKEIKQDELH